MIDELDIDWLRKHPLPDIGGGQGKEERGRALAIGGSTFVPGAIRLTGEAALRAGAGKVQIGTVAESSTALGIAFPEAAIIRLPAIDGEISVEATNALAPGCGNCDAMILGPGMIEQEHTSQLVSGLLGHVRGVPSIIDAGAMTALRGLDLSAAGPLALTPHHGELAKMLEVEKQDIASAPARYAGQAAERFGAVVALKSAETFIADPERRVLRYVSPSSGLGTAGSGDVLAGVIGGLLARGTSLFDAVAWGVWLHGEAGKAASERHGSIGYLARELLDEVPKMLDKAQ
jgi:ADP-dependent NAD(P)H-hydrate dehydratase